MTLWRISAHTELTGLGGEKTDGRWHTAVRGKRVVYLSEHPALALVEVLVNLNGDPRDFPDTYQLLKVTVEDGTSVQLFKTRGAPNLEDSRSAGDAWLHAADTALLGVPSVVCPESTNYLFNPLHPDAKKVTVQWSRQVAYDQRLFHA
jgi:RES domain-containing protein